MYSYKKNIGNVDDLSEEDTKSCLTTIDEEIVRDGNIL